MDLRSNYTMSESESNSIRDSGWSSLWSKEDSTYSFKRSLHPTKAEMRKDSVLRTEKNLASELKPDSRLANWNRWLDIHKEQQDKLSNVLKRPPQCLVMNMNCNTLYVNQQKQLITDASDYKFCDKQRGDPCFWEREGGAHGERGRLEMYRPIQKRYDRSRAKVGVDQCSQPREVEYVGVPDVIIKEKGLDGEQCLPLPQVKWDMSEYVGRRKQDLGEKLCIFQEHIPQPEGLAVIGTKLLPDGHVSFDIENTLVIGDEISSGDESYTTVEKCQPLVRETIAVAIDGDTVDTSLNEWVIFFENTLTNEFCEKSLTIENLYDCCLRYSWEVVLPAFVNSPLPLKHIRNIKTFYFNKNNGIILPKSSVKISFYFESGRAGVFKEKYNFYLSNAPDEEECIAVELQAVVDERPEIEENLKAMESYIDSCMRYTIASKTVKEVLERVRPKVPSGLTYDWMFFEEQIFVFNNPDLFYESKNVYFLKEMYKRISEGPWDFSVQTLRKKLSEKALQQDMSETVSEFTAIVCHLMKPKLKFSFTHEKNKSVYELLSCFINMMEKESDTLKCILKVPPKLYSSMNLADEDSLVTTPRSSKSKFKSIEGKKSSIRKLQIKPRLSNEKTLLKQDSQLRQSMYIGDSKGEGLEEKTKKQEYLEALYIKTYHLLCVTIDNVGAVIDSFDAQKRKGPLLSLKDNQTVYSN